MSLKLISLNIEGDKHFDKIIPFLYDANPDVVCLQELYERDAPQLRSMLAMESYFSAMSQYGGAAMGIGIFARMPIMRARSSRYGGAADASTAFDRTTFVSKHATQRFSLAVGEVEKEGVTYTIATTHFPVSDKGEATDFQREDMKNLLAVLELLGEFVVCGDFNAPRGGEIFNMLSERFVDNIPPQYATSLDLSLHRAAAVDPTELATKMVDGLFSTPPYALEHVSLVSGVSDHCAVVAEVSKVRI